MRTAKVLNSQIETKAAQEIAKRSRGTPRLANIIFKRVRDFASFNEKPKINLKMTLNALDSLHIDPVGLDNIDVSYLSVLLKKFNGGPAGLETLSSMISEEPRNIEEVYEPYLLKLGFITRTSRGRVITKDGREHLNKYHQI